MHTDEHGCCPRGSSRLRQFPHNTIRVHPQEPWGAVIRLPFLATAHRLFSRLRAPVIPGEVRRIERYLASARVFLAISALVAIWMDPSEFSYSTWAYAILGLYIVHGVVVMLLLRFRKESTPSFRLLVHASDLVWPLLIMLAILVVIVLSAGVVLTSS